MKRVHKNLLVALIVLGAGGGSAVYAYLSDAGDRDRAAALEDGKRLLRFERDRVAGGTVWVRGSTIAFARDPKIGWRLASPVEGPADVTAIEALIDRLDALRAEPVDGGDGPDALKRFELEHPKTRAALRLDGGAELRLDVGPKNAIDGRYFVTDGARAKVYSADPAFYWALDRSVDSFRNPRVFPVRPDDVTAIVVSTPKGLDYEIRKTDAGWMARAGTGEALPADDGQVSFLQVALAKRLNVEHFLDDDLDERDPESMAQWGFKPFELAIDVETKSSGNWRALLGWYKATAGDVVTPVMHLAGTKSVVEVPKWIRHDLTKTIDVLRDRALARYEPEKARRLELTLANGEVAKLERAAADAPWVLLPARVPALAWRIDPILMSTSRLRASKLESSEDKRALGLEPPVQRIAVYGADSAPLADVLIGKAASENEIYVMAGGRAGRYPQRLAALLPANVSDFADRAAMRDAGP